MMHQQLQNANTSMAVQEHMMNRTYMHANTQNFNQDYGYQDMNRQEMAGSVHNFDN